MLSIVVRARNLQYHGPTQILTNIMKFIKYLVEFHILQKMIQKYP